MPDISLLILIVIAIGLGWLMGRHQYKSSKKSTPFPSIDMLAGSDRQSETMQAILSMAEREEAVELQLNLGTFYRRRGEIDKAISIHQSLFARPDLDKHLSAEVQLALASDYLNAGLFDRAERLFLELLNSNSPLKSKVLGKLVTLYEEEQDWKKILDLGKQARLLKDHKAIAYACCELADEAIRKQDWKEATRYIERALKTDSRCIRALMLEAQMAEIEGFPNRMLTIYKEALQYDPSILKLILPKLQEDLESRHRPQELEQLLQQLWYDYPMPLTLHSYAQHLADHQSLDEAVEQLTHSLGKAPTIEGFELLLGVLIDKGQDIPVALLQELKVILADLPQAINDYQCRQCGYESDRHHWRCPSCKQWETFTPKLGHGPMIRSIKEVRQ